MTLADEFELTPEERARLDAAPFRSTNEEGWKSFASQVHLQVVAAYSDGAITLEAALRAVTMCSLGCSANNRATLLLLTARRALQNPPLKRRKQVQNPEWVRRSAATLVEMLHEDMPGVPWTPNDLNDWTTPVLERAIEWLVALGLTKSIKPRTLYDWCLEARATTPSNVTLTA